MIGAPLSYLSSSRFGQEFVRIRPELLLDARGQHCHSAWSFALVSNVSLTFSIVLPHLSEISVQKCLLTCRSSQRLSSRTSFHRLPHVPVACLRLLESSLPSLRVFLRILPGSILPRVPSKTVLGRSSSVSAVDATLAAPSKIAFHVCEFPTRMDGVWLATRKDLQSTPTSNVSHHAKIETIADRRTKRNWHLQQRIMK